MTNQNKSVGEFFDKISDGYNDKYETRANKFLAHFFRQRIEKATDGLPRHLGTVMDIGAGTGQLYRFLLENGYSFDEYVAVDVSDGMLSNSPIPEGNRHVGTVHLPALDRYEGRINHFFLLGVTTYMTAAELRDALSRMEQLSAMDGRIVCTFTNRRSVEFVMQSAMSSLLKAFRKLSGNHLDVVAAQSFPRLIIDESAMKAFLTPHGEIERVDYINQTLTPVNRVLTGASVRLESFVNRVLRNKPATLAALSSDILFRVRVGRR